MSDAGEFDSSPQSSAALSTGEESDEITTAPAALNQPLPSRPKNYRGPPSTWRSWTLSERRLAASLDRLSAEDLSIHLYNSFVLSRKAKDLKRRQETADDDDVNEEIWSPPRLWTAWPLPPGLVPAEDEGLGWESEASMEGCPRVKRLSPREVLEDILIGQVQKKAKERFLKRHEPDSIPESGEVDSDENEDPNLQEPVVMADDDLARSLAEPSVCHIMAKLDELLRALHHARQAYVVADESEGAASHDNAPKRKLKQKRKPSPTDSQNGTRRKKARLDLSINPSPSQAATDSESDSTPRPKLSLFDDHTRSPSEDKCAEPPKKRKRHYGLRDWSDIIGIASMTGWEPAIVQKAAARCATLFEEGITFRTLAENNINNTPNDDDEFSILPNSNINKTSLKETTTTPIIIQNQNNNKKTPTIPTPQAVILAPTPTPQDHRPSTSRPSHITTTTTTKKPTQNPNPNRDISRFYCPHNPCRRSKAHGHGFAEKCRLTRHLKEVHRHHKEPFALSSPPPDATPDATATATATQSHSSPRDEGLDLEKEEEGEEGEEMVGGVHVDGFLGLVPLPGSWARKVRQERIKGNRDRKERKK